MPHLGQFHDPNLSLWQSAVDEVVAQRTGAARTESAGEAAVIQRPDSSDQMVQGAMVDLTAENLKKPLQPPLTAGPAVTEGVGGFAQFCSNVARQLAWAKIKGDATQVAACQEQFAKFGQCDAGWLEVAEKFAQFQLQIKLANGSVPYRKYHSIDDFVIDGKLTDNAKIGIVGDWGTGEDAAKHVLAQVARKNPDAVIHLGDIYYSCTDFEARNYFLQIWKNYFDPDTTPSFTLSGNHDMFGGGGPYYNLIDLLHQPASYCCLRNSNWQFVMMDTGLHDRTPGGVVPTFLEDTEVVWVKQRIATAGGRKTVLLSHHQLFTRYSNIIDPPPAGQASMAVNDKLQQQLGDILPQVALWLWGHEHDFVVYEKQFGVLARCVGNGAFPVLTNPAPAVQHPEIAARDDVRPSANGAFFTHGYAIMKLQGANATVSYYEDTDEDDPMLVDEL
jgi:hypothetical protein